MYFYITVWINGGKKITWKSIVVKIMPLLASFFVVICAPLEYYIGEDGRYSNGVASKLVYVLVSIYFIGIYFTIFCKGEGNFLKLHQKREKTEGKDISEESKIEFLSSKQRGSIVVGTGIWIIIALYQATHPTELLSSIGNALMVLFIYISYENPATYHDRETNTLNRSAYHLVLPNFFNKEKDFYVITFRLTDVAGIQKSIGYEEARNILAILAVEIQSECSCKIYHSGTSDLTVLVDKEQVLHSLIDSMKNKKVKYFSKNGTVIVDFKVIVIECPKFAESQDELYKLMDYIRSNKNQDDSDIVTFITEKTLIKQKEYFDIIDCIEDSINNNKFQVYYQPIYSTKRGVFT